MKNFIAIGVCCFVFLTSAMAQMDRSIVPQTSRFSSVLFGKAAELVLPPFSKQQLSTFDYNDAKNGRVPAVARNISANITLNNTGTWTNLPGGDRVWRVQITAAGALALAPLFDRLYLPAGATMHVYMPDREEVLGAFTLDNTPSVRAFCPGLIHGETCVIEYYEPATQKNKGILSINKVGYAYRDIRPLPQNNMKSGSGPCEVNVVCPEGDNWSDQKRSVVRIFVVVNDSTEGWCSGALVNNVRKDCTPYVLSAEHCTENTGNSPLYAQWVFYFNYQATTCSGITGSAADMINGCKEIANSADNGGMSGSDFLLLELNHTPPTAFNVFYSGWDITNTAADTGVGIHHPSADIKKISTFKSAAQSAAWGNIAQGTHWKVIWSVTESGEGVTEPGSSGSPMFKGSNALIVGHLTGGGSCCAANGCLNGNSPTAPDFYGKLAYDWTNDGVTSDMQLKPWLDPDNTGTTILQGMNPPCGSTLQNDAGIQAIIEPTTTVCSSAVTPIVVLRNFGANTLTSVTISFKYDNGSLTNINWTGTLLPGSTVNVTLPSANLSQGTHTFAVNTSSPNGNSDTNIGNNAKSADFVVSGPGGELLLSLTTDNVGSKTTWQITDAGSNVVASGGPYPNLLGGTTYNIPICVPGGCYTFTIFSSQGNGMTAGEDGNFLLTNLSGSLTYAGLNNASFGTQEAHNFCAVLGVEELPAFSLSIVPNPSTGKFNITVGTNDDKTYRIFDVTGRLIMERNTHDQNFIVDLSGQSKGVYLLQIETLKGTVVKKLVLK